MTLASVIVPAHDEEAVIGDCLEALTAGAQEGELEIVVVCNGCSDATAERARAVPGVQVIETPTASKSHALRLGDETASAFPRFFVDADVVLPLESLRTVAEALREGPALAAAPRMEVELRGCSYAVRAYYAIWRRLPYHTEDMIGSGVYALSQGGRARFDTFPDVISDDGFVRLHFLPGERRSVPDAWFRIRAPRTLHDVVHVKTRSQKGRIELDRRFPRLAHNDPRSYSPALGRILTMPRLWLPSLIYLYVIVRTRWAGHRMNRSGDLGGWERDETSRPRPTGSAGSAGPASGGRVAEEP